MSDQAAMDYWQEAMAEAAESCGLVLVPDQLVALAEHARISHECYGQAFYSPPATDRLAVIEREWQEKLAAKERELDAYREKAEVAVRRALRQYHDVPITIEDDGAVFRLDGEMRQIQ